MNLATLLDAADGDTAFAREVATLYLQQTGAQLELLRLAVAQGSAADVQSIAHHCKGSSLTCGAVTLAARFDALSQLARDGPLEKAPQHMADVEREFARVRALLEDWPSTQAAAAPAPKKLLIVDDDAVITVVYERHFRAAGFDVRVANSGLQGLEAVRAFRPDAVLLDLNMADVNGVDWLTEIRSDARFADLPVLVFTAGEIGWQFWAARNANVSFVFKDGAVPANVVKAISDVLASPVV